MKKVILIDIISPRTTPEESLARLNELESLVRTYGGFVIIRKIQKRQIPDYKTYIGKGKLDEIVEIARSEEASFIIINNLLKPRQVYNLERLVEQDGIKVWDKVDIILNIFAKHATTKEAKLQIELAGLRHLGPRIFRMGAELMQQAGGIGTTRGKGEGNVELMKRHIQRREIKIKQDLKKIEKSHAGQRKRRKDHGFKTVAIVGYTNAGKSSLLRALTKKKVKVQDELFATLDSRIGKVYLPEVQRSCLVSDTIGFIRDLPPDLIDAFHSTLAETIEADLILLVVDAFDLELDWKLKVTQDVLKKLGCHTKKIIYAFNKIDSLNAHHLEDLKITYKNLNPLYISAAKRMNLDELKASIVQKMYTIS